ncbi:putative RNA methyltransferase [uncultured Psychrobacter sp.]|uniref:putative RNA methyltransferase n=1 Tax=uncultured Psychrobacter sp. TaxID=259303 RepID=UPI00262D9F93|nr:methyltransferase domain-containing protein [uncultured Psychrobacter sp.]
MSIFICPICQSPLVPAADTWRCDGSLNAKNTCHPFDVARQGYVNLLPVQQKKSKAPGDSSDSILARKRFLAAGYYQPLQDLLCEQIQSILPQDGARKNKESVTWLDIGCGEGYYTEAIAQTKGIDRLIAADISKAAVLEVAKASKAAKRLWLEADKLDDGKATIYPIVTSAAHLPLSNNSLMGISSIFSPILPTAFNDVLQQGGYVVIAKPDISHLASVREALFDEVREHNSDKFLTELVPFFDLLETHKVSTELSLSEQALADLLTMTPYAYRAQPDKRRALLAKAAAASFNTEARFVVYILKKRPL